MTRVKPGSQVSPPPFGLKILLYLTTSAWRPSEALSPHLALWIADMAQRGWMIRLATPRNYFLWQRVRNRNCGKVAVVVLAHPVQGLTVAELHVLFATDLFNAQRDHTRDDPRSPQCHMDALDDLCRGIVTGMTGLAIVSRAHIFAAAQRKLVEALPGY